MVPGPLWHYNELYDFSFIFNKIYQVGIQYTVKLFSFSNKRLHDFRKKFMTPVNSLNCYVDTNYSAGHKL